MGDVIGGLCVANVSLISIQHTKTPESLDSLSSITRPRFSLTRSDPGILTWQSAHSKVGVRNFADHATTLNALCGLKARWWSMARFAECKLMILLGDCCANLVSFVSVTCLNQCCNFPALFYSSLLWKVLGDHWKFRVILDAKTVPSLQFLLSKIRNRGALLWIAKDNCLVSWRRCLIYRFITAF